MEYNNLYYSISWCVGMIKKLHWFCFTYSGKDNDSGRQCFACTYTGYNDKIISKRMIDHEKYNAGVKQDAVLLAVSYLGYMTKAEMTGEDDL